MARQLLKKFNVMCKCNTWCSVSVSFNFFDYYVTRFDNPIYYDEPFILSVLSNEADITVDDSFPQQTSVTALV